jgi:hypothetical protein
MGSGEELVYEIEIKKPFIGSGPSKRVFLIHLLETRYLLFHFQEFRTEDTDSKANMDQMRFIGFYLL